MSKKVRPPSSKPFTLAGTVALSVSVAAAVTFLADDDVGIIARLREVDRHGRKVSARIGRLVIRLWNAAMWNVVPGFGYHSSDKSILRDIVGLRNGLPVSAVKL